MLKRKQYDKNKTRKSFFTSMEILIVTIRVDFFQQ